MPSAEAAGAAPPDPPGGPEMEPDPPVLPCRTLLAEAGPGMNDLLLDESLTIVAPRVTDG
jgi:hypothetical protein